jgi:hypothetical protein
MKNLNRYLTALVVLTGALSAQAQVRTWGFSSDAVYEFSSSVTLSNQGSDTLRFDTVLLEIVRPNTSTYGVGFNRSSPGASYMLNCSNGTCTRTDPDPKTIVLGANQSVGLSLFRIDIHGGVPTAKRAAGAALGDTMQARLIFQASAGRGRDTLLVNGTQQLTAIRAERRSPSEQSFKATETRLFDLRGRRLESVPQGLKALKTPTAPRD